MCPRVFLVVFSDGGQLDNENGQSIKLFTILSTNLNKETDAYQINTKTCDYDLFYNPCQLQTNLSTVLIINWLRKVIRANSVFKCLIDLVHFETIE